MMNIFSNWQNLWQKNTGKASEFSETSKDSSVSAQGEIQSKGLLHRLCRDITMAVFIECYCHDIFKGLGEGTPEEIIEAWNDILSDWSSLMRNEDSDYLITLADQLNCLKFHIAFVEYATFYLQRVYDLEIIDRLINECGYDGSYPEDDRDAYLKQLSRVISLCKTKVYEASELSDEIERLQKNNKGEKTTEEEFVSNMARLSKYQGYRINKFKIDVFEYTQIHNNFISEIKNSKPPDG